ncbi:MAG: hypothetical protein IMY72_00590 [Bacteroidetes bacterium]|nr:hypothetical protein [Bacteroidota bacterium]
MKYQHKINQRSIVFSRWTRKSYAVFASLGKIVSIGHLSFDTCMSFFSKKKTSLNKLINNTEPVENEDIETETFFSEWLEILLIELGIIKINEEYNSTKLNIYNLIQSIFYTL